MNIKSQPSTAVTPPPATLSAEHHGAPQSCSASCAERCSNGWTTTICRGLGNDRRPVPLKIPRPRPFVRQMACDIISTRGALFALWGKPTVQDVDRVWAALHVAVEECGYPVVYIARLPRNSPPPDAATRARLDELMPNIVSVCSSYHVVLEGDGFGAAVKRGILTGLFQLSWRRKTFFVHASVSEVARNVNPEQQQNLRKFKQPAPVREVSLVVHRDFIKKKLIEVLKKEILAAIPEKVRKNKKTMVVSI